MVRDLADKLFVESLRLLSLTELPRSFAEDGRLGADQEGPLSEWRLAWALSVRARLCGPGGSSISLIQYIV